MEQHKHYIADLYPLMSDLGEIHISTLIRIYLCSVFYIDNYYQ